jgi:hypothetical protein
MHQPSLSPPGRRNTAWQREGHIAEKSIRKDRQRDQVIKQFPAGRGEKTLRTPPSKSRLNAKFHLIYCVSIILSKQNTGG